MIILNTIGPIKIISFLIIYILQLAFALYLVGKYEKGVTYFIWVFLILFIPFIGNLTYFIKSLNKLDLKKVN